LRELEHLRYNPVSEKDIVVKSGVPYRLKEFSGDDIEIMATIRKGEARRYALRVLCDKDNGKGIDVVVDPERKIVTLGSTTAPLELKYGEDIQLHIFVDRSIVEVFVNDRQALLKQHDYAQGDVGVCLLSEGGNMQIPEVRGWKIQPSNPW
jgi:beta-fructofuranosidase